MCLLCYALSNTLLLILLVAISLLLEETVTKSDVTA